MKEQTQYQILFNDLVNEILKANTNPVYQSVISMVYTLIEDKHLISLNRLLKENYPEYYSDEQ
jgi:hypothetical protein